MRRTVLILAGGKGQRFQSRDKCFIMLDGKPLLQHAIDNLSGAADELIIAARDERQGERIVTAIPDEIVVDFDTLKGFGPLAGVLSGLERASYSFSFIVGCDMPFVDRDVVDFLFDVAERGNYDAVVPRWENGMVEPLHAVYKREAMLAAVRDAIKRDEVKMYNVFSQLKNVEFLSVKKIQEINPELKTFRNINTPDELKKYASVVEKSVQSTYK